MGKLRSCLQDFWQIYFVVTQKDGVDDVEHSLGSSWGLLSGDENQSGIDCVDEHATQRRAWRSVKKRRGVCMRILHVVVGSGWK